MATVYDVNPEALIQKAAKELESKPEFKAPEWAIFVKTGTHKQRPPTEHNWWQIRAAAILRTIYIQGPVGVNRLRIKYGGRKNMGYRPERFKKGSGSVARKALQQLEKAGFIKQVQKETHKGRIITPEGKKFLDHVATQLSKKVAA
jgi:small subunit ribosomal protein S19e